MAAQFGELTDDQRYAYRYWLDNKSTVDSHHVMEATTEATAFANEATTEEKLRENLEFMKKAKELTDKA